MDRFVVLFSLSENKFEFSSFRDEYANTLHIQGRKWLFTQMYFGTFAIRTPKPPYFFGWVTCFPQSVILTLSLIIMRFEFFQILSPTLQNSHKHIVDTTKFAFHRQGAQPNWVSKGEAPCFIEYNLPFHPAKRESTFSMISK